MTPKLEKACNILMWAIDNRTTITKACNTFKVPERYIRSAKTSQKDEGFAEFLKLYNKFKGKDDDAKENIVSQDDLLPKDTVVDSPYFKFTEEQKNKGVLDARGKSHVRSLDQIVAEANIDLQIWNIDRHVVNKWDVTNAEGQTFQNWQVKVWLSKRVEVQEAIDASKLFQELVAEHVVSRPKIKYPAKKEQNLLEVNIFDLHLGKLCWGEEVNNNYDIKIASKRFDYALDTILKRAQAFDFERILFPIGNDFFNSDNHLNTTTLGTRQDEDVRWQKSFKIGHKLLTDGINRMREFAPVDIIVIPGNHDFTKSFYLGEVIGAFYRNDESVMVNNSPNSRKYYEYGNTLLGFTHGDKEKPEMLRSLMSGEAKEAWARTLYKEWHVGHQHRKLSTKYAIKSNLLHEELGVVIRGMASLAGTDVWHHQSGYVGPIRAAEGFMWSKEMGMVGSFNANIKLNDDL